MDSCYCSWLPIDWLPLSERFAQAEWFNALGRYHVTTSSRDIHYHMNKSEQWYCRSVSEERELELVRAEEQTWRHQSRWYSPHWEWSATGSGIHRIRPQGTLYSQSCVHFSKNCDMLLQERIGTHWCRTGASLHMLNDAQCHRGGRKTVASGQLRPDSNLVVQGYT